MPRSTRRSSAGTKSRSRGVSTPPEPSSRWVSPPPATSQPGGPSTVPGRPPVPARLDAQQQMAWDRILRGTSAAAALYRPAVSDEPCNGCDVDCCTGVDVPLNVQDVRRISVTLGLAPAEFVTLLPWHARLPVHPVAWSGGMNMAMVLKQRTDRGCAFLLRVGTQRRCGNHALRPDACRIFPFVADKAVQAAVPSPRLMQLHPGHCPWRWPETPERRAQLGEDLDNNARHRVVDRELLSTWKPGRRPTEEAFLAWLEAALTA